MTQPTLFKVAAPKKKRFGAKRKSSVGEAEEARRKAAEPNRMCAEIILNDVEKWGGDDSLMVRWSRLVEAKCTLSEVERGGLYGSVPLESDDGMTA